MKWFYFFIDAYNTVNRMPIELENATYPRRQTGNDFQAKTNNCYFFSMADEPVITRDANVTLQE